MWNLLEIAFMKAKKTRTNERNEKKDFAHWRSEIYALQPFIFRWMSNALSIEKKDEIFLQFPLGRMCMCSAMEMETRTSAIETLWRHFATSIQRDFVWLFDWNLLIEQQGILTTVFNISRRNSLT